MEPSDTDGHFNAELLPPGSQYVVIAANQKPYRPLPSVVTPDGKHLSAWTLTDEEAVRLIRGEPLYLIVWTFGQKQQPVWLGIGHPDLREPSSLPEAPDTTPIPSPYPVNTEKQA